MDHLYNEYFESEYFYPKPTFTDKIDVEAYLKNNTVIKEWDNTLPILLYHGISMSCEDDVMLNLKKVITQVGEDAGKDLHVECIIEGVKGFGERFTSIFGSMTK